MRNPYTDHRIRPSVYVEYLVKDKSPVDFVFQLLIVWGMREIVTNTPAVYPNISKYCIDQF